MLAYSLLGEDDSAIVWVAEIAGRPALLATRPAGLVIAAPGVAGLQKRLPWAMISRVEASGSTLTVWTEEGDIHEFRIGDADEATSLYEATRRARAGGGDDRQTSVIKNITIVTTNDVPGFDVIAVHGDVFGIVVRSRNVVSNVGAGLKSIVGGEIRGYTTLVAMSRNDARERLAAEARARGANAVVAMRFDCNDLAGTMSEVTAYGTAVTIQRTPPLD